MPPAVNEPGPTPNGSRKHVTRACESCRARRSRCDGAKPVCMLCRDQNRQCSYPHAEDGRRLRVRSDEVATLKRRVHELEDQLSPIGIWPASLQERPGSTSDSTSAPSGPFIRMSGGSLTLEPSGALRFSDYTSSFFRTSPLDMRYPRPVTPDDLIQTSYLPVSLDVQLHATLVDLSFVSHLYWGKVIPEIEFRHGLANAPGRRTLHFSPFLHLIVLAYGCRYLPPEEAEKIWLDKASRAARGDVFAAAASSLIEEECINPNLGTIHGLLALSAYKVGRGEDRLANMFHGLALGLAQDFRLHLAYDASVDDEKPVDWSYIDQARISCFWMCSVVDVFWCSYLGRESSLPRRYLTQPLPKVLHQLDRHSVDLAFAHHARLSAIASAGIEAIYSSQASAQVTQRRLEQYGGALDQWYRDLPDCLRMDESWESHELISHVITLNAFFHAIVIIIHRPFIIAIRQGGHTDGVLQKCFVAGRHIVRLLQIQKGHVGVLRGSLSNQHCASIAGSALLLVACGTDGTSVHDEHDREEARVGLEFLTEFLQVFAYVWDNAGQSAAALEGLLVEFLMPAP